MQAQQHFLVEAADKKQLRRVLGQFATGVTVITTTGRDGAKIGMTANSFSSVSLEPALILWNIAKTATNVDEFRACEYFAINILNDQQEQISNHFAKSSADKFSAIDKVEEILGVPVLSDALATLVCKNHQWIEAGDHYIVLGQVEQCSVNSAKPLLFQNGQYHRLHPAHFEQCA